MIVNLVLGLLVVFFAYSEWADVRRKYGSAAANFKILFGGLIFAIGAGAMTHHWLVSLVSLGAFIILWILGNNNQTLAVTVALYVLAVGYFGWLTVSLSFWFAVLILLATLVLFLLLKRFETEWRR